MTDHGRTIPAFRPIAAGHVLVCRQSASILIRSGEDVVLVDNEQPAGNAPAGFRQASFGVDLVASRVQIVDAAGNLQTRSIDPGTVADPVPSIDGGCTIHRLNTQIRAPGFAAGASLCRERLT